MFVSLVEGFANMHPDFSTHRHMPLTYGGMEAHGNRLSDDESSVFTGQV